MNCRSYLLSALFLIALCPQVFAQDETDALRYSYLSPFGTARSAGFGNALGSIGGDFTSLSVNPAGIGVYRKSEFTFTPAFKINSTQSTYQNVTLSDNNVRFNINNVGLVFTTSAEGQRYDRSDWKSVSFGIGMTRLADFCRNYTYAGNNSGPNSSSYSELFSIDANTYGLDQYNQGSGTRAYNAYLIDYDSLGGGFATRVPYTNGIRQGRTVRERGGTNEIVLSFGGNYQEKLMLGATLGIPLIYYDREATVSEVANNPTAFFSSFYNSEKLTTHGTGINLKVGAIYKVNDNFRLGAAIHTPTYYGMHDEYGYVLTNSGFPGPQVSPLNVYDYGLTTPWRAILSASVIVGKSGFITADYETVNYASARFHMDAYSPGLQDALNTSIANIYKTASNFRVGGELKLTDNFMVRAGFGFYGSPYKSDVDNYNRIDISGGIGYRVDHFFIDIALQHSQYTNPEQFYALYYNTETFIQNSSIKNSLNNLAITFGFKM